MKKYFAILLVTLFVFTGNAYAQDLDSEDTNISTFLPLHTTVCDHLRTDYGPLFNIRFRRHNVVARIVMSNGDDIFVDGHFGCIFTSYLCDTENTCTVYAMLERNYIWLPYMCFTGVKEDYDGTQQRIIMHRGQPEVCEDWPPED